MFSFLKYEEEKKPKDAAMKNISPATNILTNGLIIRPEGEIVKPVIIDSNLIQKDKYIPLKFAEDRMLSIQKECKEAITEYEQRLTKMKQHHESNIDKLKHHYENFILDMKSKARQHIELLENTRTSLEQTLHIQHQTIEEIRDNAAENTKNHQNEVRLLKQNIQSVSSKSKELELTLECVRVSEQCNMVMQYLINNVESKHHESIYSMYVDKVDCLNLKIIELERSKIDQMRDIQELNELITSSDNQQVIRETMSIIVNNIEDMFVNNQRLILERNIAQLNDNVQFYKGELNRVLIENKETVMKLSSLEQTCTDLQKVNRNLQDKINDLQIEKITSKKVNEIICHIETSEHHQMLNSHASENITASIAVKSLKYELIGNIIENIITRAESSIILNESERHCELRRCCNELVSDNDIDTLIGGIMNEICHTIEIDAWNTMSNTLSDYSQQMIKLNHELDILKNRDFIIHSSGDSITSVSPDAQTIIVPPLESESNDINYKTVSSTIPSKDISSPDVLDFNSEISKGIDTDMSFIADTLQNTQSTDVFSTPEYIELLRRFNNLQMDYDRVNESIAKSLEIVNDDTASIVVSQTNIEIESSTAAHDGLDPFIIIHPNIPSILIEQHADEAIYPVEIIESTVNLQTVSNESSSEGLIEEMRKDMNAENINYQHLLTSSTETQNQELKHFVDAETNTFNTITDDLSSESRIPMNERMQQSIGSKQMVEVVSNTDTSTQTEDIIENDDPIRHPDDIIKIELLEDQLLNLNEQYQTIKQHNNTLVEEKDFVISQLNNMTREKRTDVIKQYEEEVISLKHTISNMTNEIISFKSDKVKQDKRVEELTARATIAEKELKDRDLIELNRLNQQDEKYILKSHINKQRDELILKAKAATAGWDAAANADEKMETEVERAYSKGYYEGRQENKQAMNILNKAIEEKENRLTELIVKVNDLQKETREYELIKQQYQTAMDAAKQETTDMMLLFSQMSTSLYADRSNERIEIFDNHQQNDVKPAIQIESNFNDNTSTQNTILVWKPSQSDYNKVKDMLDQAQEDLLTANDQLETVQEKLNNSHQKSNLLEQMLSVQQQKYNRLINKMSSHKKAALLSKNSAKNSDVNDLMNVIKSSLNKGNSLMKTAKKDDCYDLYYQTNELIVKKLISMSSSSPSLQALCDEGKKLCTESNTNAKLQLGNKLGKSKIATTMKRSIEKLLLVIEATLTGDGTDDASAGEDHDIEDLTLEMNNLQMQMSLLESFSHIDNSTVLLTETKTTEIENLDASDNLTKKDSSVSNLIQDVLLSEQNRQPIDSKQTHDIETVTDKGYVKSLFQRIKQAEQTIETQRNQLLLLIKNLSTQYDPKFHHQGSHENVLSPELSKSTNHSTNLSVPTFNVKSDDEKKSSNSSINNNQSLNNAEIRKLQRKVKELQYQLQYLSQSSEHVSTLGNQSNSSMSLSTGHSTDLNNPASIERLEKQYQKKLKTIETNYNKEKKSYDSKILKLTKTIETNAQLHESIVKERDVLREKIKSFHNTNHEIDELRLQLQDHKQLMESYQLLMSEKNQLYQLYQQEYNLRKKYKNDYEDLKGSIRVYGRCRPMNESEKSHSSDSNKPCMKIVNDSSMILYTTRGEKSYEFDTIFNERSKQEEVFEDAKRLIESCMDGYNVCIFAYGQTGSGKTFTMTGTIENPGLTPRSIHEIFTIIQTKSNLQYKISTYFVELYNDNLVDLYWLLDNRRGMRNNDGVIIEPPRLDIKLDSRKMVAVTNVIMKEVTTADELMTLYDMGNAERHTGSTRMNATSSRSHSIFAIMIESYDPNTKRTIIGKLSLVDLAGSERADKTGATGNTLKEAQSINKSLSALGNVVAALSEGEKHIPYRSNKLTMLMQDSLGGNAKTLMFVNFSPSEYNIDETYSSLNYATRVKKIVNSASKQSDNEEITRLKSIIKRLQEGQSAVSDEAAGLIEAEEERMESPYETVNGESALIITDEQYCESDK